VNDRRAIVVVDDAVEIVDLLTIFLTDEGFRVVACQDGRAALDTIMCERPDLVILDLMMSDVPGWELVDGLTGDARTAGIPFIVCSGAVTELRAAEARIRALGGDVLVKPFDLEVLLGMIRRLIGDASPA